MREINAAIMLSNPPSMPAHIPPMMPAATIKYSFHLKYLLFPRLMKFDTDSGEAYKNRRRSGQSYCRRNVCSRSHCWCFCFFGSLGSPPSQKRADFFCTFSIPVKEEDIQGHLFLKHRKVNADKKAFRRNGFRYIGRLYRLK